MEEFEALQAIYGEEICLLTPAPGYQSLINVFINQESSIQFKILKHDQGMPVKPEIEVISSHPDCSILEELLKESLSVKNEAGCLFEIIELARQWFDENKEKLDDKDKSEKDNAVTKASICKFYLEKKCRFGEQCLFRHPKSQGVETCDGVSEEDTVVASNSNLQEDLRIEKNSRDQDIKNDSKKVSMKTATDVINRIIWDDDLPTEDFIVGYLDRFIGIVEKAFTSFSWEDIASVDYSTLAIPKHRIQYFKYKSAVIWDKRSRIDKVFGSTGSTERIQDIIRKHQESKQGEEGIDSNDGLCEVIDCDDDDDDEEDGKDESGIVRRKWKEKDRPNFFFCFRITSEGAKEKIGKVQDDVIACEDVLQQGCLRPSEFHVTLCMLRLNNDEEKARALEVLKAVQPILVCMLPRTRSLLLEKLGNFRGRVLHVEVSHHTVLAKFVDILLLKLKDAGLHTCGNRQPYCPHITIVKLSRPMCRTRNSSDINPAYYAHYCNEKFGEQAIEGIKLCSTGKQRDDTGFYVDLASKSNSLLCISEKIATIVSSFINELVQKSVFSEEEGDRFIQGLSNTDEDEFEQVVMNLEQSLDRKIQKCKGNRLVIILRGLPGSGKSTLVKESKEMRQSQNEASIVVCGADEYFENSQSGYSYSGSELAAAHAYCRNKFLNAIEDGVECIVIDNTNSQTWEYHVYKRIGRLCGYDARVLEIGCINESVLASFVDRTKHRVDKAAIGKMWQRWETDKDAHIIQPSFDNSMENVSLLDVLHKMETNVEVHPKGILFSALYLDDISRAKLLEMFPAAHAKITASHMTLTYKPMREQIPHIPVGKQRSLAVVGYVCTDVLQAVAVSELEEPLCGAEIPHVTISHSKKAAPKHAKSALENIKSWKKPERELTLTGTVGLQVAISEKKSIVVINAEEFEAVRKQIDDIGCEEVRCLSKEEHPSGSHILDPVMYIGSEIITSLYVFDFDGTLFHTPDPLIGRRQYRDLTGERWPHKEWISRPESLQHPLQSLPGPSFIDFKEHLGRSCSLTVLLTARLECVKPGVEEVLRDYGMQPQKLFLKPYTEVAGDDYKRGKAPSFKADVIRELLKNYPDVSHVKIWDDRQDNMDAFRRLKRSYNKINFELFKVGNEKPKNEEISCKDVSKITDAFVFARNTQFSAVATKGIDFIMSAWSACLEITVETCKGLVLPFGSFPLKRIGDVDLCLLAPSRLTADECIVQLEAELSRRGIRHIHSATRIRCPRLKVCLHFENAGPVDYDIVFAPCLSSLTNTQMDAAEVYENGSKGVKSALEGVLFLQQVKNCIAEKISLEDFGVLVDLVVLYLKTKHLKGNAFHCFRTFHLVRALAEMYGKLKQPHTIHGIDDHFRKSILFLSNLDLAYWKRVCKDYVPEELIARTMTSFTDAVAIMERSEQTWPIFAFVKFPPDNHTTASVTVKSHVSELQWRASTLLEARIGTCVRKLISSGADVVPGPCDYSNIVQFAVPTCDWTITLCKDILKSLKREAMFLDNKDNLDIIIDV